MDQRLNNLIHGLKKRLFPTPIDAQIRRLQKRLFGTNYQVTLGFVALDSHNIWDAVAELKTLYPNAETDKISNSDRDEFWSEVHHGFNYRGDEGAGLKLSPKKEADLQREVERYSDFLKQYISDSSEFICLDSDEGLPILNVFWGYHYYIINQDGKSCFVYGASAD